jgi:hypothetical protein
MIDFKTDPDALMRISTKDYNKAIREAEHRGFKYALGIINSKQYTTEELTNLMGEINEQEKK